MSQYDGPEKTLVPGNLRGYRLFRPSCEGLASVVQTLFYWKKGVNSAKCALQKPNHEAPDYDCVCGFYAKYHCDRFIDVASYSGPYILASISAHGRIILGTDGFRAQKAQIEAISPFLYCSCGCSCVEAHELEKLADIYEVELLENPFVLTQKFPPSDVSELIKDVKRKEIAEMGKYFYDKFPQQPITIIPPGSLQPGTIIKIVTSDNTNSYGGYGGYYEHIDYSGKKYPISNSSMTWTWNA